MTNLVNLGNDRGFRSKDSNKRLTKLPSFKSLDSRKTFGLKDMLDSTMSHTTGKPIVELKIFDVL